MLETVFVFIFGAAVGSFLNVVAIRMIRGQSFLIGRSRCPACGKVLKPFELLPILSFIFLRGRCLSCKKKIDPQYFLVELFTGILFVLAYWPRFMSGDFLNFKQVALILRDWFFISALVIIFLQDLRHMVILDKVTIGAAFGAIFFNFFILKGDWLQYLLAALFAAGFFGLQYVISGGKWIGDGDIRLGALMGLILGLKGTVAALLIAYISGAFVGLVLLALKKRELKSPLPFGTFLSLATVIALIFGDKIIGWYLAISGLRI